MTKGVHHLRNLINVGNLDPRRLQPPRAVHRDQFQLRAINILDVRVSYPARMTVPRLQAEAQRITVSRLRNFQIRDRDGYMVESHDGGIRAAIRNRRLPTVIARGACTNDCRENDKYARRAQRQTPNASAATSYFSGLTYSMYPKFPAPAATALDAYTLTLASYSFW